MKLIGKGSKPYSIATAKCPKCQEGEMFVDPNPYHLRNMDKMHASCSVCGQDYEPEPNFYYGAMYVSYALNVAVGVAAFIISYVFCSSSMKQAFITIIISMVVGFPYVLRLSRNIYINMFVDYDENFKQ